ARPSPAPMPIREPIGRLSISPVSLSAPASTPAPAPTAEWTTSPEVRSVPPSPKARAAHVEWEGLVLAALNRAKRYPRAARRKQQEGTSWIDFVIDRRGRVRSVRLERSSGVDVLDREALALPERAQLLPRPPESVEGERIRLLVPIEFFIR